ncbi:hypothetical protein M3J09_002042 [Ascochyta lentis]
MPFSYSPSSISAAGVVACVFAHFTFQLPCDPKRPRNGLCST